MLSTSQEDDILLRNINVVILQKEDFVDPIVLQRRELKEETDWTREGFLDDQILFPTNLRTLAALEQSLVPGEALHTPCRRSRRSLRAFSFIWSVSMPGFGTMFANGEKIERRASCLEFQAWDVDKVGRH